MFLLILIINIVKLKNLAWTLDKFYKAKVIRFIKTVDKTLSNLYIYLLYSNKQKI